MSGCDVDEPYGLHGKLIDFYPLVIDSSREDPRPECLKRQDGTRISGVLHADTISWLQEEPARQVERFLYSSDDCDLLGDALNTPRPSQVLGYRLAERHVAEGIAPHQLTC